MMIALILNLIVNAWVSFGMGQQYGAPTGFFCLLILLALTSITNQQKQQIEILKRLRG
jgi:hypothetical protein